MQCFSVIPKPQSVEHGKVFISTLASMGGVGVKYVGQWWLSQQNLNQLVFEHMVNLIIVCNCV